MFFVTADILKVCLVEMLVVGVEGVVLTARQSTLREWVEMDWVT
jgi:hypothetical protein